MDHGVRSTACLPVETRRFRGHRQYPGGRVHQEGHRLFRGRGLRHPGQDRSVLAEGTGAAHRLPVGPAGRGLGLQDRAARRDAEADGGGQEGILRGALRPEVPDRDGQGHGRAEDPGHPDYADRQPLQHQLEHVRPGHRGGRTRRPPTTPAAPPTP